MKKTLSLLIIKLIFTTHFFSSVVHANSTSIDNDMEQVEEEKTYTKTQNVEPGKFCTVFGSCH